MVVIAPSSRFEQMPYDCMIKCWDFLDDKTVISTAVLSKSQSTPSLKSKRDAIILALRNDILFCRAEGYPEKLVQAFRLCNRKIHQLPVLNLNGHTGMLGCIDFVEPKHMSHPVMRFKDAAGRPGIIFNLEDIPKKADLFEFRNPKGTMALFQQRLGNPDFEAGYYSNLGLLIGNEHLTHDVFRKTEEGHFRIIGVEECTRCLHNIVKGRGLTFKHAAIQKKVQPFGIAPPVNYRHIGPIVPVPRNQPSIISKVIIVTSLAIIALALRVRY